MCDNVTSFEGDVNFGPLARYDFSGLPACSLTLSLIAASVDVCAHEQEREGGAQTGAAEEPEDAFSFSRTAFADDAGCSKVEEFKHISHVLVGG